MHNDNDEDLNTTGFFTKIPGTNIRATAETKS
jgi:hypothetical protein